MFLFGSATLNNLNTIMEVINTFGDVSGLRINLNKSSIIFPPKMNHLLRAELAGQYNLRSTTSFGKYLGINISANRLKISNYSDLLQKPWIELKVGRLNC